MEIRQSIHSAHFKTPDTAGLRREFLVERLFVADRTALTDSHIDRIIVGAMPVRESVAFDAGLARQIGAVNFLDRRELGLINIGGPDDLAGSVVFLASAASDYVNGYTLAVDGGWLAR